MEYKFILKIKDEKNPPVFNEKLGKGVLAEYILDYGVLPEETKELFFIKALWEKADEIRDEWIEVKFEKVNK